MSSLGSLALRPRFLSTGLYNGRGRDVSSIFIMSMYPPPHPHPLFKTIYISTVCHHMWLDAREMPGCILDWPKVLCMQVLCYFTGHAGTYTVSSLEIAYPPV